MTPNRAHRGGDRRLRKVDLFTQNRLTLCRVNYGKRHPKDIRAWESEVDPAFGYIYDKRLRFGNLAYELRMSCAALENLGSDDSMLCQCDGAGL